MRRADEPICRPACALSSHGLASPLTAPEARSSARTIAAARCAIALTSSGGNSSVSGPGAVIAAPASYVVVLGRGRGQRATRWRRVGRAGGQRHGGAAYSGVRAIGGDRGVAASWS
jgi:hypothetical protein